MKSVVNCSISFFGFIAESALTFRLKRFLTILTFCLSLQAYPQQKQAAVWCYGTQNKINFNYNPVNFSYNGFWFSSGVASISDSAGNYLFSFNGDNFFDKNDYPIVNMIPIFSFLSNLSGADLIIPFQNDKSRFHVLSIRRENNNKLYRFVFDLHRNGGLGGLDTIKTLLIDKNVATQLTCMLHSNGKDTWLVGRRLNTDTLISWLVQDTGIVDTVYSKINSPSIKPDNLHWVSSSGYDSQLKSSPNSEMLLIPRKNQQYAFHDLLRFDRATGRFHSRIAIPDTVGPNPNRVYISNYSDACFSPDSKLLYIATGTKRLPVSPIEGPGNFWQYKVDVYDSAAIQQSKLFIGRIGRGNPAKPEIEPFAPRMQLAMDGKIYVSPGPWTDSLLSVIHCPDKRGADCRLSLREFNLQKGRNGFFFPTLNQTLVRNAGLFQLLASKRMYCAGASDTLELSAYGAGAEHFQWSVSPALPAGLFLDTLTWQKIPTQSFLPGNYTFSCQAFSRCGDVFQNSISISVRSRPAAVQPQSKSDVPSPCNGDSVRLFVENPLPGYRYFWSTGQTAPSISVLQSGTYSLDSLADPFGCSTRLGDSVQVSIRNLAKPAPPIPVSSLEEFCLGKPAILKVENDSLETEWNTGQTGDSLSVDTAGWFWARSVAPSGCVSAWTDTLQTRLAPLPVVAILQLDSVFCPGNNQQITYRVVSRNLGSFEIGVEEGTLLGRQDSTFQVEWFPNPYQNAFQTKALLSLYPRNALGCPAPPFEFRPGFTREACRLRYPLFIPNLITQNGDGKNDHLLMGNALYFRPISIRMYDRWGKQVFETSDYENSWPPEQIQAGTYFYRIKAEGVSEKGWIEVLKK